MKTLKGGYHGKLLRINLSINSYKTEEIPEKLLIDYIGGRGLASKILFDEIEGKTDALSAENKLIFATGPLTGINAPTTSRFSIVSKSPLSGTINACSAGGHFGLDLKSTGFDVLIIEGVSEKPSYIFITDSKIEIRDASEVWGLNTHKTTDILLAKTNENSGVACIGPSGENKLNVAGIMNEKNHAAGRGGLGAVMGSKNLKAVVVYGNINTPFVNNEVLKTAIKKWRTFIGEAPLTKDTLKEYGTPALVKVINRYGALPTRNFQEAYFVDSESISAEPFKELYFDKRQPCAGCPIACARLTKTSERAGKGPEFETIWAFGALCGVDDLEEIINANYNCNEYGIDTISTGNTIACAMELSEKGYFSDETYMQIRKISFFG